MYAKIFRQIYESSIADNPQVRFTFMDLLVLADSDGVVDMTHESIARITNCPLEWVKSSISALEQPDPRSRTPDENGARLKRLDEHRDWGWVILNYDRFRNIANDIERRSKTAARVQRHRSKARQQELLTENVTPCNATETLSNAGNAMQRQRQKQSTEEEGKRNVRSQEVSRPSLEEVLAKAQFIGLAEWKARDWFEEMEGCGWIDYLHRPVVNWTSMLTRICRKWESDGRPNHPPCCRSNGSSVLDLKTIIEAKEKAATELKNRHCIEGPLTDDWSNKDARDQYISLKKEIRQLNTRLGAMA